MSGDELEDKISPSMRRKLRLRRDSDSQASRSGEGESTGGRSSKSKSKSKDGDKHKQRTRRRAKETKSRPKSRAKRDYSDDEDDGYGSDRSFEDKSRSPRRFVFLTLLVLAGGLYMAMPFLQEEGGTEGRQEPTRRVDPYEEREQREDYERHENVPRRGCGMPLDYGTILEFMPNDKFEGSANYYVGSMKCTSGALCNEAKITGASCRKISCGSDCPNGLPYECNFVSATDYEAIPTEVRCRRLDGEECPPCQLIFTVKDTSSSGALWLLAFVAILFAVARIASSRRSQRKPKKSKKKSKGKKVRKKGPSTTVNGKQTAETAPKTPANTAKEKEVEVKAVPKQKQSRAEEEEAMSLASSRVSDVESGDEDIRRVKEKWRETRRKLQ